MARTSADPSLLPGTLDLLILKTLSRGPMHGYAIAADEALEFARLLHRVDVETLSNIEHVNLSLIHI